MTPPTQPHKEWIISDVDYHIALEYFHFEARPTPSPQRTDNDLVIAIIRRFSELPELKNLPNAERNYLAGDIYNLLVAHDAHIRTTERNATLDAVEHGIRTIPQTHFASVMDLIESLRTQQEQQR